MDDFGAHDRSAKLDDEGLKECFKALAAVPFKDPLLYARVDLLRDNEGKWVLTELELVEPSLFFRHANHTGMQLAKEVQKILKTSNSQKPTNLKYNKPQQLSAILFWIESFTVYFLSFPLMLTLAYRFYWQHGDYSSNEHMFLFCQQAILTCITFYCHFKASTCDPGFV